MLHKRAQHHTHIICYNEHYYSLNGISASAATRKKHAYVKNPLPLKPMRGGKSSICLSFRPKKRARKFSYFPQYTCARSFFSFVRALQSIIHKTLPNRQHVKLLWSVQFLSFHIHRVHSHLRRKHPFMCPCLSPHTRSLGKSYWDVQSSSKIW